MPQSSIPPTDGSLLTLINFLDFNVKYNAEQPFYIFPSLSDPTKLTSLSYLEVAWASHRIAHILRPNRRGNDGDVVGVLLHTDTILYAAVVLGVLRAGLVPYVISPRNSAQAICQLLDATSSKCVISQASLVTLVSHIRADRDAKDLPLDVREMPALSVLFPALSDSVEDGLTPFQSDTPADIHGTAMFLHSSGSTGFPKTILFTHYQLLKWSRLNVTLGSSLRRIRNGSMGLPTFHAVGMFQHVCNPLMSGSGTVVYAPQYPAAPTAPHPQSMYELAKLSGCTAMSLVPSVLEAWSKSEEKVQFMSTLRLVTFAGGPLSQAVGDRLEAAGVPLRSLYGGTEFASPMKIWSEPITPDWLPPITPNGDWAWLEWSSRTKTRMEPQGDGTYELVITGHDDYPIAAYNIPGEKAYATSDLFERHPSKEGLWRMVGRKDDVIILSTGEKIVPIPQEGHIGTCPMVMGCLMFGREREQAGLLVELAERHAFDPNDEAALVQFRNELWPVVEEANATAPAFAKIFKEMIIVTDSSRPLPRAGKGTIQRKAAISLYADEIEKLYKTVAESTNVDDIALPESWSEDELVHWLSAQAASVNNDRVPSPDLDLFQQGFDSLSATFFRNHIIGVLRAFNEPHLMRAAQSISPNLIFEYPTILDLASFLSRLTDPVSDEHPQATTSGINVANIEALVHKYTSDLPKAKASASSAPRRVAAVLLTGSTGNIGSHILASLLADDRIARVYTLNRPSTSPPIERLKTAFSERALPVDILDNLKLSAFVGDINQTKFGLEPAAYEEVLSFVTHIIHNAWTVNFNLPLQSYEDQIAGVRRLVDVCGDADYPIKLLCTSSVGAASLWDADQGPVPERPLPDPAVATSNGYSASKYIVEQILDKAAANGLCVMAVRMGQACGSKATGAWGTTEWMPIMVKSSLSLGCFPEMSGLLNWVPLDAIGSAYIGWVIFDNNLPLLVNVVHPRPTSWDVVLRGIRTEVGGDMPVVPLDVWVAKLDVQSSTATAEDLARLPALKLIGFFRGLVAARLGSGDRADSLPFATDELQRSSPTMCELQPLSEEHARMWVRYWKSRRYL
ncbi:uncharacterized protein PHACADRAFT_212203 [Phanerochaete carnosa HHB-10118-sp]|uniref:Polyketide synthase-like phosphopantetheine-binding domain-containing protein n=1 Tax=Phanerochaete carnosa (strain HHB-10118-sp) TaxID=650164 RepID=K5VJN5_PHACS|nr:uncharacterized protein PHACADRAFT_212203 [Phanerochaete carnosa HHB-10118-sp]EKM51563.1 hypothetical protein PHACADRAFT_212203 [Phanerochaete carnosa HHB-10118-sp]